MNFFYTSFNTSIIFCFFLSLYFCMSISMNKQDTTSDLFIWNECKIPNDIVIKEIMQHSSLQSLSRLKTTCSAYNNFFTEKKLYEILPSSPQMLHDTVSNYDLSTKALDYYANISTNEDDWSWSCRMLYCIYHTQDPQCVTQRNSQICEALKIESFLQVTKKDILNYYRGILVSQAYLAQQSKLLLEKTLVQSNS